MWDTHSCCAGSDQHRAVHSIEFESGVTKAESGPEVSPRIATSRLSFLFGFFPISHPPGGLQSFC